MYQGKRIKKQNKRAKRPLAIVAAVLMLSLTISGTLAFLVAEDEAIENVFTPSSVTTEVVEEFDGKIKENVQIKNTGNIEAWIRAAVVITWQNDAGEVYGQIPAATDYVIAWGTDNGWIEAADGFWYYAYPVAAEASTKNLIESCQLTEDAVIPEGYSLNVEIIGSGIQSKPDRAVIEAWGVTVHTAQDGSKTISK